MYPHDDPFSTLLHAVTYGANVEIIIFFIIIYVFHRKKNIKLPIFHSCCTQSPESHLLYVVCLYVVKCVGFVFLLYFGRWEIEVDNQANLIRSYLLYICTIDGVITFSVDKILILVSYRLFYNFKLVWTNIIIKQHHCAFKILFLTWRWVMKKFTFSSPTKHLFNFTFTFAAFSTNVLWNDQKER